MERPGRASVLNDYLGLAKPRVVLVHLVTAASAMFLAVKGIPPVPSLLFTLVGGGLVASAANTLNCYLDRKLDGMMVRTRHRPLPAGRLKPSSALGFGIIIGMAGLLILSQFAGLVATALAVVALAYYLIVYTYWLKRRSYWSVIIGSGAGAFSPLIGWVAVIGHIDLPPFILAAIVSLWTLPHFWALAFCHRNDYQSARLTVLPARNATRWIIACSLLLVAVTLSLVPAAQMGLLYLGAASLLGLGIINLAVRLHYGQASNAARYLYVYSIVYLIVLFIVMAADRLFFSV